MSTASDRSELGGRPSRPWSAAPRVPGAVPWAGPGLSLLRDPTRFFARQSDRFDGTYWFESFGYRVFCVFSPEGVKSLWSLPESEASKGLGDFALLSHKVPAEIFAGRRTFPHQLFSREDIETYLGNLTDAVELEIRTLGAAGELEAFAFCRRLAHRMGLASWGSREAAGPRFLEPLIGAFDRLDSSESFVHPWKGFWTAATRKRSERAALGRIEAIYSEILRDRAGREREDDGFFERIVEAWGDTGGQERIEGIARDVILVHMGSQSNLFAAMAWTLVHLLERPTLRERVLEGDDDLLERCAHESIRLRQRSIVLRRILKPCVLADERAAYDLEPGLFLATMMSVTNTTAAQGLDVFDPENYRGPLFARNRELAARELVTTFGHGAHYCPAARFSISAIRIALRAILERFELEPRFRAPAPLRRQIGGVARADRACTIRYAGRSGR